MGQKVVIRRLSKLVMQNKKEFQSKLVPTTISVPQLQNTNANAIPVTVSNPIQTLADPFYFPPSVQLKSVSPTAQVFTSTATPSFGNFSSYSSNNSSASSSSSQDTFYQKSSPSFSEHQSPQMPMGMDNYGYIPSFGNNIKYSLSPPTFVPTQTVETALPLPRFNANARTNTNPVAQPLPCSIQTTLPIPQWMPATVPIPMTPSIPQQTQMTNVLNGVNQFNQMMMPTISSYTSNKPITNCLSYGASRCSCSDCRPAQDYRFNPY